ncbi:PIG-L family deacetylase [Candidatus Woesearchaeota archaeon]|nr:PIG-L family deacetylase [Candidatus Woesearchaeota archaeon]
MNVLVVAAHPDDEILGVGGTLLKHRQKGDTIYVCIVTKAYEPQWTKEYIEQKIVEQKKVDEVLGVKKRFNLNLLTVKLNTLPHGEINKRVADVIEEVNPDIVYTHFEGDINYDHTIVFRACMVATRPPKQVRLLCFETPSETEWNNKPFNPNLWININEFINQKIEAFKIYELELKKYPHPRSLEGVRILAKKRGLEICKEYAEAFIVVRDFG